MKRALLIVVVLLAPQALAQRELASVFSNFSGQLERWCPNLNTFDTSKLGLPEISEATTWLFGISPSISRASYLIDGFLSDMGGFMSSSVDDLMELVGDVTGRDLGGFDVQGYINAATAAVRGDIEGGTIIFAPVVGQLLARAGAGRTAQLSDGPRANATRLEKRINASAATDPTRLYSEMNSMAQTGRVVMRAAQAGDVASMAREMAGTSLARGDEEQLLKRVTSPDPTGVLIPKGTADKAEDAAKLCVSTRWVVQANLKFATDVARQEAVSTANIVTAVKEVTLQQSLTTQQLATLAQGQADASVREFEKWRDDYYVALAKAMVNAQNLEDTYASLAELMK